MAVRPVIALVLSAACLPGPAHACDLDAWSSVVDGGGSLAASEDARYDGACGLRVDAAGGPAFVEDATPGSLITPVSAYAARFYLYAADVQLADGDAIEVFAALDADSNPVFRLQLYRASGDLFTRLVAWEDGGATRDTGDYGMLVQPGWRALEIDWRAAGASGANDGELTIGIDGFLGMATDVVTGIDNDTLVVDRVRLGLVGGAAAGATGVIDFDAFASGRAAPMGMMSKSCSGVDVNLENATFLPGTVDCVATGSLALGQRVTFDPGSTTSLSGTIVRLGPGVSVRQGAALSVE